MIDCACAHQRRRVVLTGGPGAGKTAVLELIHKALCAHVKVLPEAAGVVFGGGFPREDDPGASEPRNAPIYHVQREFEATGDAHNAAVVLCDRGSRAGAEPVRPLAPREATRTSPCGALSRTRCSRRRRSLLGRP
jgi:hypothetical protein